MGLFQYTARIYFMQFLMGIIIFINPEKYKQNTLKTHSQFLLLKDKVFPLLEVSKGSLHILFQVLYKNIQNINNEKERI